MVHLRIVTPEDRTERVVELLTDDAAVCNVIVLPGAARRPAGDVVLADVAREDASVLVSDLRGLRIHEDGSIAMETIDTAISRVATRAIREARGDEADAVVWEQVEARTSENAALSASFLAFMALAAIIAAVGILLDSPILIVGAMVVGPEFGPLAGVCVGLVNRRGELALRSLRALAVGFPVAIVAALALGAVVHALGLEPDGFSGEEGIADVIASPDHFSAIVAFAAGVAGMLSLTTAKSAALIGVLISVTTIPSAAGVGLFAAEGDFDAVVGSAAQLGINVAMIMVAGLLTLEIERAAYRRRRRRHVRERSVAVPGD